MQLVGAFSTCRRLILLFTFQGKVYLEESAGLVLVKWIIGTLDISMSVVMVKALISLKWILHPSLMSVTEATTFTGLCEVDSRSAASDSHTHTHTRSYQGLPPAAALSAMQLFTGYT